MARAQPEKRIQREMVRELTKLGFEVMDMTQPRATQMPVGLPDLYARHAGWRLRIWIEVKTPKGKLSLAQMVWHAVEREAGGIVIVARSVADLWEQLAAHIPVRATP